ncbi:MAG: hypothetical protein HS117_16305 [Verrucomicrobiaceae bacterium]|nr:hypothetical protein [Verrucomicrobiaceae bacterium]
MKTRTAASRPPRKPRAAKLIRCGPDRKMTLAEILAEDAQFMRQMGTPSRAKINSTKMIRAGR